MNFIINALVAVGTAIYWVVETFFPFLLKKFGLAAVKFFIQKSISVLLLTTTLTFWGAFVVFIVGAYVQFKDLIVIISNPSSEVASGVAYSYFSCFLHLLDVSGFSSGFTAGFSFTIAIFVWMFSLTLYTTAIHTLKLFSDELSKLLSSGS